MSDTLTISFLGCGNLGSSILQSLLSSSSHWSERLLFSISVRSQQSVARLVERFGQDHGTSLTIRAGWNVDAVEQSSIIILAADPADIKALMKEPGLAAASTGKLLISIVAGWTRPSLEQVLYGSATTAQNQENRAWIVRTLPNIAASVSQSMTVIETAEPTVPEDKMALVQSIFATVGKTVQLPTRLMPIATAVGGSTPAFFAIICDAMIDAAVATGLPRDTAQAMIYQAMQGTASLLQSGINPGQLKEMGTSPAGCTIGGVMVLEEQAVRGQVGRALRESIAIARQMGDKELTQEDAPPS